MVLKEITSEDLSYITGASLEALDYTEKGIKQNQDWLLIKLQLIKKAKEPRSQTEIMLVIAREKLIKRVAEL